MSDNVAYTPGSGATICARSGTYSGDTALAQAIGLVTFAGSDDAKTITDVPGGNGVAASAIRVTLASDGTGIVALTTSTASIGKLAANSGVDIGDVDVTSVPADPFGVNADAASATGSISAKLRFIAATGIPVTGTVAVTQSGTWNITNVSGTVSLPTGAATAAKQPALGTAGTASSDVITVQGIASMTKLLVTPDLPSGASTAAKQPALGTAGTAATDVITVQGIASMTKLLVTPDSIALPANQSVNVSQINGVTVLMGNGASGTGAQRVTIANDSTGQIALAAGTAVIGHVIADSGSTTVVTGTVTVAGAKTNNNAAPGATNVGALTALANASAPSWTEGNLVLLSTDLAGALRVSGGGGGTQYAQGSASTDTDTLTMAGAVRRDTAAVATGVADGDRLAPSTDSVGRLRVTSADLTQPVSAASLPLPSGASTAAKQPALGTAGTASSDVITVQGVASMTKLLVTPDANSAVNVAQINGVTVLMGNGASGTGAQRVTLANDSTGVLATVSTVTNLAQLGGAAVPIGAGTEAAAIRVTLPTDGTGKVSAAQSGTWTVQPGNTPNTTAWIFGHGKTLLTKTGSASATFTIVAAVASKKIKVYSLSLMTASTSAVTVTFKDGAAGTAISTYILQAITGTNFGITENVAVPSELFETTAGVLLEMSFGAAVAVIYNLRYWADDAT